MTLNRALFLLVAIGCFAGLQPSVADEPRDRWEPRAALLLGVGHSSGAIGSDTNATGEERLVARLPKGPLLGVRLALEAKQLSVGLEWISPLQPIEVESEAGIAFPNHGTPPLFYSFGVELHPAGYGLPGGELRPYLAVGLGGALLSVDLDNRRGQELTHHGLWKVGAGARWRRATSASGFWELRYEAVHVHGRDPLEPFTWSSLILGYGIEP